MPQASSGPAADPGLPGMLRKAEIFSSLLDDDLAYAASRVGILRLSKGQRLFEAGQKASRFYVIRSGGIRVFRPRPDGGEDDMALFASGDVLGDFDFARGAEYDAGAEAVEDTELVVFPRMDLTFDDLARERPDAAARLLLRSLAMISGRLRATHKLISENAPWVRELHRQAYEDPGTGLWSKAFLDEELPRYLVSPTALVLIKPDRFKILVDSRGHAAGDEAMARIAAVLQSSVRALGRGWAIRVRSNETAVVVPGCPRETAAELARSVADGIADLEPVPAARGVPFFEFTASVVHSVWPRDGDDWKELFQRSQECLMAVWGEGGRRILAVPPGLRTSPSSSAGRVP